MSAAAHLGLAKRAGKLEIGEESVAAAAHSGKVRLMISASDAAERSQRRALSLAEETGCIHITVPFTKADLGSVLGRGSPGIIAVTDAGLASGFLNKLAAEDAEAYGEAAVQMKAKADRIAARRKVTKAPKPGAGTCKRR